MYCYGTKNHIIIQKHTNYRIIELARANQLEDVKELLKEERFDPTVNVWRILLAVKNETTEYLYRLFFTYEDYKLLAESYPNSILIALCVAWGCKIIIPAYADISFIEIYALYNGITADCFTTICRLPVDKIKASPIISSALITSPEKRKFMSIAIMANSVEYIKFLLETFAFESFAHEVFHSPHRDLLRLTHRRKWVRICCDKEILKFVR